MNTFAGLVVVVVFFGGLVGGWRVAGWPRRRLLADEPTHGPYRGLAELNRFLPAAGGVAWMLVVAPRLPFEWLLLTAGFQLALWTECLPYAAAAAVFGVWAEPLGTRLGGPADVIVTGPVRRAGLLGVGLSLGVTAGVVALRAVVG